MQLKQDARVYTAAGQDVGRVDRVVLDPNTKEITHVVVHKGLFFTQDKVVPIRLIADATEARVTLRENARDLHGLPNFEETHFVVANEREAAHPSGGEVYVPSLYLYPPNVGTPTPTYSPSAGPAYVTETEENIPEGTVALREGAKVVAADGINVGHVEQVLTDAQSERATHFVISKGLLLKERKLVPVSWTRLFGEKEIHLAVGSHLLEALRPYQG